MVLLIVIALNIPLYLLLAWIIFDTPGDAAKSVSDTVVLLLKMIFIPRFMWGLLGMDETDGVSIFALFAFFVASIAMTGGELYLIDRYWFDIEGIS